MSNWIVIPVKRLTSAKSRLSKVLSPAERSQLQVAMLRDVLAAAVGVREADHILLVTADSSCAQIAREARAEVLPDVEDGLNQAIGKAIKYSVQRKATKLLIVHADIPLVRSGDLSRFFQVETPGVMIAPSHDFRGTNVLCLSPPDVISPRYGWRSFDRHHVLAEKSGIVPVIIEEERLALDIDTPFDLRRLCDLHPYGYTRIFLREHGGTTRTLHKVVLGIPIKRRSPRLKARAK